MQKAVRIGTRDSQLAIWQATLVQNLLNDAGHPSELVYIKSEGDIDTVTPLYALGVQGIFTKTLDAALLSKRIDIAVHSMKDVPTVLAKGIQQAAVLKRASYKDIFVYKEESSFLDNRESIATIATSSIRRKAQWLHQYPNHSFENLRGNVNTRLRKVTESHWQGAIFAAAGVERIGLRPTNSIDLNWMLPAPAQGAIMIVCREDEKEIFESCQLFNDEHTALCTKIERDFLRTLLGGCSTPISALAAIHNNEIIFNGNICSPDGKQQRGIQRQVPIDYKGAPGVLFANEILAEGAHTIMETIRKKSLF